MRETQALGEIAKALKFASRKNYEDAVRKLLIDDEGLRNQIREKFGDLAEAFEDQNDDNEIEANAA